MAKIKEIDYDQKLVKKETPYLDQLHTLVSNATSDNVKRFITIKQRCYAWYYVFNNGNKADAYRRAYKSHVDPVSGKLVPDKEISYSSCAGGGCENYNKPVIQQAIALIRKNIESKYKQEIGTPLLEQLVVQATYDPSMFIKADGRPAFDEWEQIPEKYRCCVAGIETRHFGKNSERSETVVKLVDRATARKELLRVAPGILEPEKLEILHKTLDKDGKETGIDFSRYSDEDLLKIIQGAG